MPKNNQSQQLAEAIAAKLPTFKTKQGRVDAAKTIEEELSKLDATQFLLQLEDYSFLLPKEKRDEAIKAYEECGEVRVTIHRTTHRTNVTLEKVGADFPSQNAEIAESVATPNGVVNVAAEFQPQPAQNAPQIAQDAPEPAPEPKPAPPQRKGRIAILLATNENYNPRVMLSILGQWKATIGDVNRKDFSLARVELVSDTLIHAARNELAHRFLNGSEEWAYWQDSDIIAPIGNPAWFQKWIERKLEPSLIASPAVTELVESAEKNGLTILSGIYSQRNNKGRLVAPDTFINGSGEEIKRLGPIKGQTRPSAWIPFGCCVTHRSVFESIKAKHPELAPKKEGAPWNFFGAEIGLGSEDVAFCKRAADAGHAANFDLGLWCAHIGNYAFMP